MPPVPPVPALDPKLLELLVCPVTKGPLVWRRDLQELQSRAAGLAYPVRDGLPILLEAQARALTEAEHQALRDASPPLGTPAAD